MCIYTRFRYLCMHEKIKIAHACNKAILDPHGILICPDDPSPKLTDGVHRTYADRTYGVGVCSSIHCAWDHSILPLGDFGDDKVFDNGSKSFEDDTAIDNSYKAREDRLDIWYRLLTTDQQLEHFSREYPTPLFQRSVAGRVLLDFPHGAVVTSMETLLWHELNPVYLTPAMLQWFVFSRVLPASLVDNRKSNTISPRKPIPGPFKVNPNHKCPKKHGICKVCGENIGETALKETTLKHRQKIAMSFLLDEDLAKQDPKGTSLDPSVDLKWDDAKGEYIRVPRNFDLQLHDAPYPASSNPAFVQSLHQPVDTAAVFSGQDAPFANAAGHSLEMDYNASDWDAFASAAETTDLTLVDVQDSLGELSSSVLFGLGDKFSAAQAEMDQQFTFNAEGEPMDFPIDEWNHNEFDFLSDQIHSLNNNSSANPPTQTQPSFARNNLTENPTTIPNHNADVDVDTLQRLADDFIAEQQASAQVPAEIPAETLRLVHQMVYRMAFLGEARASYDTLANELFARILTRVLAGRI